MTIVLEATTPTGLDAETHQALLRLVAAIKHTLRMGNQGLPSALRANGVSSDWRQIDSDQLAVVISDAELITLCGQYAPLTTTDEGVEAARAFVELLTLRTKPQPVQVTWLDYLKLHNMLQQGVITEEEHKLLVLFISAVQRLLAEKHPGTTVLRLQLPDPPRIDGIMYNHVISDLMLLTAIDDWHQRHILLETFPATITYDNIQQLRGILGRLMTE